MPQPIHMIKPALPLSPIKDVSSMMLPELDRHSRVRPCSIGLCERSPATHAAIDPDGPLSRLLAAAVISRSFCHMLLTNPGAALAAGYRGEPFALSTAEKETLLQLRATSLREFAQHLLLAIQEQNDRR